MDDKKYWMKYGGLLYEIDPGLYSVLSRAINHANNVSNTSEYGLYSAKLGLDNDKKCITIDIVNDSSVITGDSMFVYNHIPKDIKTEIEEQPFPYFSSDIPKW